MGIGTSAPRAVGSSDSKSSKNSIYILAFRKLTSNKVARVYLPINASFYVVSVDFHVYINIYIFIDIEFLVVRKDLLSLTLSRYILYISNNMP